MPLFPSRAWMDEFCDNVRAHPRAGQVAVALDGVFRFVVEPAGTVVAAHTYDVEIRPDHAGGAIAAVVEELGDPRLTLSADAHRWEQVIIGELDLGLAVMLRRLRISGDLPSLRGELGNAKPLLDALRAVHTEWPR